MHRVLVVEDNTALATNIIDYLTIVGMDCDYAKDGEVAINLATNNTYDAMVLDLNLPKIDGLSVCRTIRGGGSDCPIIMLTAKDTLEDKLTGFDAGADDYLVKPFSLEELTARLRVLVKRRSGEVKRFVVGDMVLDIDHRQVTRQGQPIKLSPTAFKILEVLARETPHPVSKEKLHQAIWGNDTPETNSLKVHLYTLRKQLETDGLPKLLHTVPGFGVALKHEQL